MTGGQFIAGEGARMGAKLRTAALLAILVVLLGGLALTLWRGDVNLTQLLLGPLGLIVPLLLGPAKNSLNGGNSEGQNNDGELGAGPTPREKGSKKDDVD